MVKRLKRKSISILIIACLCMNFYMPVTHAQDTNNKSVNKLSMKLDLKGFSTYHNNNYVFEFGQDTGYSSAKDIWLDCITEGFSFKLDKALSTTSALGIMLGYTSSSNGSFIIGDKTFPMTLNYKGGEGAADWTFEEVNPNINYYERFINTDSQKNVTTVLINDIHGDRYNGTNFKQVFIKGMQDKDGASVKSELVSHTDNVDIYKLTATIGDDDYEYNARITSNCNHSSVKSYACDSKTHVKDYIVDYLEKNNMDQSTYADYCVDMCSDCGKLVSLHRVNDGTNLLGDSEDAQEGGKTEEPPKEEENNPPGGIEGNQEGGKTEEPQKEEGNQEAGNSKLSSDSSANISPTIVETHNGGLDGNESKGQEMQTPISASKPYISFSKNTYKIKKGKKIKIKFESSGIDYKKIKVKASKKGCVSVKKIGKSYILIKANKKANLTITLKYKSLNTKIGIKIR